MRLTLCYDSTMSGGTWYVYILASHTRVLYVGVTNDLERRCWEHRNGRGSRFAAEYNAKKLVYFEPGASPQGAIAREKQIKSWRREKKVALIESVNPRWEDLLPPI